MIEIRHLRKVYPNAEPLKDVNAVINQGDIISIIGPSGTGKSTFIRCINMLDIPTSGQIIVDGEDITAPECNLSDVRKKMGMVFQQYNLFNHMTVIENVMYAPMKLLKLGKQEAYDNAIKLLDLVGMGNRQYNYPDMLSGGQKQRVAIARALAMKPQILLLDEPTSALDPTMVGEVQAVIRKLAKMGTTMMIVTHEMKFAREICNRAFYMDEGGIYEEGTPEQIFDNPQKDRTRQFIKHLKVLNMTVDERNFDFMGAVTSIDQFGYKNDIPPKMLTDIQSVFEELCQVILFDRIDDAVINFTVEYDKSKNESCITCEYEGERFNPMDSDKSISLKILTGIASSAEYNYYENEQMPNRTIIKIQGR